MWKMAATKDPVVVLCIDGDLSFDHGQLTL
jgi:hypothetical protein